MTVPFLSLQPQHEPIELELQQTFQRVLKSNWFILGKELENFERSFARYCETKFSLGVANGLDAITLSLQAVGVREDDEVIVPSHTYIATWLAVSAIGAKIIPVEPDAITYNIDPSKIEAAISKKTKAIVPVHLYGQACDMTTILQVADKYTLHVVEDNAQSQGALCAGRKTGSFGICNATSFYPGKNLGALGDGGAITTNSEEVFNRVSRLRNYGSSAKYYHEEQGVNSRLDEVQAALLSVKLKYLDEWTNHRRRLANLYLEKLRGTADLILPQTQQGCTHVYHLFVVRTRMRDQLQQYLSAQGIQTMIHYPVPPHLQGAYKNLKYQPGDFPIAEELANTSLSLPLWPGMSEEMLDYIVDSIRKFYHGS